MGLFDIRKISQKLHAMELGEGEITQVAWSPHDDPILASASAGTDNRIVIWDLRHIGEEQTQEDAEDGPPEVMVTIYTTCNKSLKMCKLTFYYYYYYYSLFIVVIQAEFLILVGTQSTHGFLQAQLIIM